MRIGLWLNTGHFPAGGPTVVLIGLIIGLKQVLADCLLVINDEGDININLSSSYHPYLLPENIIHGPNPIHMGVTTEPEKNMIWKYGKNITFTSYWVIDWLDQFFPIKKSIVNNTKNIYLWESGIDTSYFVPSNRRKVNDFFIYYKSQNAGQIEGVWGYLFHNYYGLKGQLLCYHFYKPEMLRDLAQNSKFCIMVDNEETQGLAALEIMACGCPIFCIDKKSYIRDNLMMSGSVTSICSWSDDCGVKSPEEKWKEDFPIFLTNIKTYNPAKFVHERYSFSSAARSILAISSDIMRKELLASSK
jgi:hypothetical protein